MHELGHSLGELPFFWPSPWPHLWPFYPSLALSGTASDAFLLFSSIIGDHISYPFLWPYRWPQLWPLSCFIGDHVWPFSPFLLALSATSSLLLLSFFFWPCLQGLAHEHQRVDRDKYIKIMMDNVFESHEHNFVLDKRTSPFGVRWDSEALSWLPLFKGLGQMFHRSEILL